MNQEGIKKRLDVAKDTAQNALSGIKTRIKDVDKEKAKEALNGAKEKVKGALAEIKANFKADAGAEGVKKYQSMFINLWKSGTTGKVALAVCLGVLALIVVNIGGGNDAGSGSILAKNSPRFENGGNCGEIFVPDGMFAIANQLYVGMPVCDALEACRRIVSREDGLGIEDCRPPLEKMADPANEKLLKLAEADVDRFLQWQSWDEGFLCDSKAPEYKGEKLGEVLLPRGFEQSQDLWKIIPRPSSVKAVDILSTTYQTECKLLGKRGEKIEEIVFTNKTSLSRVVETFVADVEKRKELFAEKGLVDVGAPVWSRLVLKTAAGVLVKKSDVVDFWLGMRGHLINKSLDPKPLIKIGTWELDGCVDKLKAMCFVSFDEAHKVKEVYCNERGMAWLFTEKSISAAEFANRLVEGFKEIPRLSRDVTSEDNDHGSIRTCTWTYKNVNLGYEVEVFDRSFRLENGQEVDFDRYSRNPEMAVGLAFLTVLDKQPKRYFRYSVLR